MHEYCLFSSHRLLKYPGRKKIDLNTVARCTKALSFMYQIRSLLEEMISVHPSQGNFCARNPCSRDSDTDSMIKILSQSESVRDGPLMER